MIGILNDKMETILKHENGEEFPVALCKDFKSRTINNYFIKDDMELGVIYTAITGNDEYFIVKILSDKNEIVIRLKKEELKNEKRPFISVG